MSATELTKTLIKVVGDWDRSGIAEPLPRNLARDLWARWCQGVTPRNNAALIWFQQLHLKLTEEWELALRAATEPVLHSSSIITETRAGIESSEFARVHTGNTPITSHVWDYLVDEHGATPDQRLAMGIRALAAAEPESALRLFGSISPHLDGPNATNLTAATAQLAAGMCMSELGSRTEAVATYTSWSNATAATRPRRFATGRQRLVGRGYTLGQRPGEDAVATHTELVERYQRRPGLRRSRTGRQRPGRQGVHAGATGPVMKRSPPTAHWD